MATLEFMSPGNQVLEPDVSEPLPNKNWSYGDEQWQFESQVVDWFEEKEPQKTRKDVTIYKDVARISDGFEYQVHTFIPNSQKTDVPVVFTTPWLTSDGGHNRHAAIKVAELGYPVILVGPEGNYREPTMQWIGRLVLHGQDVRRELNQIEMARTAHNMHQILDANGGHHYYDQQQMVLLGESRGAMVGMGLEAFSDAHGRNVIYADLVAPCFAEPFDLREAAKSIKYPEQGWRELQAIGRVVTKATWSRLRHYPDTFNLSPKALLHQAFTKETLFSGQAGEMARHIPTNRNMHVLAFKGDHAGQAIYWERIFGNHEGVTVDTGEGSHLTIADPDTLQVTLIRLTNLRHELERNEDDASAINYERVHLRHLRSVA